MSLIDWIVCLCQLYSEDKQEMYNVKDFVYKIMSIIVYILEI